MQPRILTLPDSIRDRLEAAERTPPPRGVHKNEHLVREAFFPLHPVPEEREFLQQFQEAYMGMHDGSGSPAVALSNLPEHHKPLFDGLVRLMGDGKRHVNHMLTFPIGSNRPQLLHHDQHYKKGSPFKALTIIHYLDAGTQRQPTVFVTADEVIDAWAARWQEQRGGTRAEQRAAVIDMLSKPDNPVSTRPAIARNPNHTEGNGPEYILVGTFTDPVRYAGANKPESMLNEFDEVLYDLVKRESKVSTVGTQTNTLVMFNQGMCLHAAGYAENPSLQEGRAIRIYDMHSRVPHTDDVASHVTAQPISKVQSVRLFDKVWAQWHQR